MNVPAAVAVATVPNPAATVVTVPAAATAPATISPAVLPGPRILRIFISYASEDIRIATAIFKCFHTALGDFSEINMDRSFLEAGQGFGDQIRTRLEQSDVFISVYLGLDKQWPAYEIGYFQRLMNEGNRVRELVPIYLDKPPSPISEYEGLKLDILPEQLQCSLEDFTHHTLTSIDTSHPIVKFVARQRDVADTYRKAAGMPAFHREPDEEPVACVQRMLLEIYNHLRTTVEATFRPQKQILIRTTDVALKSREVEFPSDARLIPLGLGDPMSIFGLTGTERTWQQFVKDAERDEHLESWRAAIVSVVTSSLDNSVNVDNSQIIVSSNSDTAYRVILTSNVKYYDGKREFNLYFVEMLRREDFGDNYTSLLLKALDVSCRFRSMFFESGTPFSSVSVHLSTVGGALNIAAKLVRELNLLRKDARDAGLDKPSVWLTLVDPEAFRDIVEVYQPLEKKIREVASQILEARTTPDLIPELKEKLAAILEELKQRAEPGNARLIQEMTSKLRTATTRAAPAAA
jgi:hypothetical protein